MFIIYGCVCCWDFIWGVYLNEKKLMVDGVEKCCDLFVCFVKEDEVVIFG